ncbi:class I SAM-dependent methyltransferase [Microbacterium sp. USHLN186]|uniref:class I SAM-dependent methyltransferase n=1 Tax=Microbacterium sp. USHLN186 TaxID=3081286 RepID=UPI003018373F
MTGFDYQRLRRYPDVEAPNLQAWDATDELLVQRALDADLPGDQIAVIGDEYGAISLALTDAGLAAIRVHQDLITGRRALGHNARSLELSQPAMHELDSSLLTGARLVLLKLPRGLAELGEVADAVGRWAAPEVTLIAGGRVKHMTTAQNGVLAESFAQVQPQRAERKSRLIVASEPRIAAEQLPFPVSQQHDGFTLCAYGAAFAGPRLDIGTRVLLDALPTLVPPALVPPGSAPPADPAPRTVSAPGGSELRRSGGPDHENPPIELIPIDFSGALDSAPLRVIDLGCGTGALAVAFALQHPDAAVIATDRSAAAVRSAEASVVANGLASRITVTLDDAGSELPDGEADLVLLNPPFHLGATVHEGAGRRLIEAAGRLVRPGGEVWTVFNSHLDHRRALSRHVGPTEQIARTPKFTVTRSVRRG